MVHVTCIAPSLHLTNWDYCPVLAPAALFSALYGTTTLIHIFQAAHHRKPFLWVLIMGAIWLTAGYIIRSFAIMHQKSDGLFDPQFILILISPLWINAFAYVVLGRMIDAFVPEKEVLGIKARRCAVVFVGFDIFSFIIQVIGAIMTVNRKPNVWHVGIRVYTAGVAFQFLVICAFLVVAVAFEKKVKASLPMSDKGARRLIFPLYFSLGLIMFRILFRVIEFSSGRGTPLSTEIALHEWYQYIFDAVPMLFALVGWNLMHPGTSLGSQESAQINRFWKGNRIGKETSSKVIPGVTRGKVVDKDSTGDNVIEVV